MNIAEYLKDKILEIFIIILTIVASFMFMNAIDINIYSIVFIEMMFIISFLLTVILDFYKKKRYFDEFLRTFIELDEKSYITEIVERPNFAEGRILYDLLKQNSKYVNDRIASYNHKFKDYREYIETWVHEVKSPIATSKLLIENNKNIVTLSIEEEIDKIDDYIEQVLYVAKIGSVEKDYHVKKLYLKSLVMNSIKVKSKEFITKEIKPILGNLDFYILSDSKWVEFIIGQIISNSIKYRSINPQIEFYSEKINNKISLYIKDNGIGISSNDLPKIFEKGYTGSNGRDHSSSTGIGLYICKELCEKLEVDIYVVSELDIETIIKLTFIEAK